MKFSSAFSIVFLLLLLGCTNIPQENGAQPLQNASAKVKGGLVVPDKGLPAQTLQPGECGLFLWTRREQPEFVFFSGGSSEKALFWNEGAILALKRVRYGGDVFGQQLTEQGFASEDGRDIQLTMTPGDELVSGQRVPVASLQITDSEGWKTMVPVAGVAACQPED